MTHPFERDKTHNYKHGEELQMGDLIISKTRPKDCQLRVVGMLPWRKRKRLVRIKCMTSREEHEWWQIKPVEFGKVYAKDHFIGWFVWPRSEQ